MNKSDDYDERLSFGRIKFIIEIERRNNRIIANGLAEDLYNFEHQTEYGKVSAINNAAFVLQKAGKLKPYVWRADIHFESDEIGRKEAYR